jgi:hypothetical protein
VVDGVDPVDELAYDRRRQHRVHHQVEAISFAEMEDVGLRARREVVEGEHFPPLVEQALGEMRADEAGAAGDKSLPLHGRRSLSELIRCLFMAVVDIGVAEPLNRKQDAFGSTGGTGIGLRERRPYGSGGRCRGCHASSTGIRGTDCGGDAQDL